MHTHTQTHNVVRRTVNKWLTPVVTRQPLKLFPESSNQPQCAISQQLFMCFQPAVLDHKIHLKTVINNQVKEEEVNLLDFTPLFFFFFSMMSFWRKPADCGASWELQKQQQTTVGPQLLGQKKLFSQKREAWIRARARRHSPFPYHEVSASGKKIVGNDTKKYYGKRRRTNSGTVTGMDGWGNVKTWRRGAHKHTQHDNTRRGRGEGVRLHWQQHAHS